MPITELAIDTAIKGIGSLALKSFGEFLKDSPLKSAKQQVYNWSETYTKKYLKRHGQIQILGMSQAMSLNDIYTNVRLLDAEMVKLLQNVEGLEKIYREANQRGFGKSDCAKQPGMDVANTEQYLCVLGGPGIGKTTFLRKVGLEALIAEMGSYDYHKIPVFLELKRFREPNLNIKECIVKEFQTCGFPNSENFTEHSLKAGNLLILLDGLDEVPSDNFNTVVRAIKDFSDEYSQNRFIASCRTAAYNTYFTGFRTVTIAEFSDEQIYQYIKNWFQADPNPNKTSMKKAEYANTCWTQLKDSKSIGTKELSQTPLLLTFVCLVFRQTKTITDSRAILYSKALDILLDEWAKSKCLEENWEIYQDLNAKLERDMLAAIAYTAFEEDKLFLEKNDLAQEISAFLTDNLNAPKHLDSDAVISAIAIQQGILVERAVNVYSFSHLTLQEYLCAEYIRDWNLQEKLVKNHATDPRWREVFFLVTGLMGRAAIGLLEKLEAQIQELSKHPKLKGLLAWAEEKTTHSTSEYSGETKRIFALLLILASALARILASDLDIDHASDLEYARASASTLASDLNFALNRTSALDLALDLALNRASALSRHHFSVRDLALDLNRALVLAHLCLERKLLVDVDLQSLKSDLENYINRPEGSAKELTSIIRSSLDIFPIFIELTFRDVQAITNYLTICHLMLNCSKQASGLSAQQWEAIRERMFLPKSLSTGRTR